MALDVSRLEKVKDGANGGIKARCPACAANGEDNQGNHLYIYPSGKFGCAKYPNDRKHRSHIARLAGGGEPVVRRVSVKVKPFKAPKHTLKRTFGTDGTPFSNLRACAEKIIVSKIDTDIIEPAGVKDLEIPVPNVPDLDKSLIDNESDKIGVIPAWIEEEIRSWGWLWEAVDGWDARLVGAVWECEVYGDMSIAK